jgi:hypothetical protein
MSEGHTHDEELKELTVTLEVDQVEILEELAVQYSGELGQDWDLSAVLRVAVGHFLTKMGRIT